MNYTKKFLFGVGLILLLITTACSSGGDTSSTDSGSENGAETIEFKFSHNQPKDSPEYDGAEAFKEIVEEKSNGRIKVDVYPNSQLGSLREQTEATQLGEIEMTMQPTAVVTPFVEAVSVIDLPYLWPKETQVRYDVLDGEMGDELLSKLEDGGFKGLGFWPGGFKLMTTNNKEIHKPEDLEGLKMRTMESPLLLQQYETWGAQPVPVPYAEVYNSLQQGVVDGQENPLQTIYLNKYYEVQDNVIQTYHGTMTYITMANKQWFDALDKEAQEIIMEAEEEARNVARESMDKKEENLIEKIKESGVNYYELTDEEIQVFTEASKPTHEKTQTSPEQQDFLERLYKAIEEAK